MTFITIFIWTLTAFAQGLWSTSLIWIYFFKYIVKVLSWFSSCCVSECRGQITVTQSPSTTAAQPEETVKINCKTSKDVYYSSYWGHYLAWYLQRPGEAPKLLNWFILQTPSSQELHLDSVAVDLTVISLWPSVESRLKMLDIITVRVTTAVVMCSHSDKESYKNLGQSESQWLNWSCSCSNTITHYWHTETNTATRPGIKGGAWGGLAPLRHSEARPAMIHANATVRCWVTQKLPKH